MTESTTHPSGIHVRSAEGPSFWEDLIDIFFRRRRCFAAAQNKSVWPPLLFVAISIGVIVFATFNTLQPIFEAEFTRGHREGDGEESAACTPEQMDKMRDVATTVGKYVHRPVDHAASRCS